MRIYHPYVKYYQNLCNYESNLNFFSAGGGGEVKMIARLHRVCIPLTAWNCGPGGAIASAWSAVPTDKLKMRKISGSSVYA